MAETKVKTIHALFVGINNYPNPRHRLGGCLEDVNQLHQFLASFCEKRSILFNDKIIKDTEASHVGIITGFEHFKNAKDDDICFFFFAGHGSRVISPRAFLHLETDGYIESLVLYDSRTEGGRDLTNKELSWLIWQVTKDLPNLQFISIMDCCHSGRVTRTQKVETTEALIRTVDTREDTFEANTLLGFSDYQSMGNSRFNPPIGRQVLLAASKDKETAKEVFIKEGRRGVFSYCLLELLERNEQVTYSELINRVNVRIKNVVKKQSPQIMSTFPMDKEQYFLTKTIKVTQNNYILYWDDNKKYWFVNAGYMQGVLIGNEQNLPQFKLLEGDQIIKTIQVLTNYTVIEDVEQLDRKKSYSVRQIIQPMTLIEAKNSHPTIIQAIKTSIQERNGFPFKWITDRSTANFEILALKNSLTFQPINRSNEKDLSPIFPFFSEPDKKCIDLFIDAIEKYYQWVNLLKLQNPDTKIQEEHIDISFYRSTNREQNNNTVFEKVNTNHSIELFFNKEYPSISSKFKLLIKNKGEQNLWVSACYFDADYSIQNHLIDIQELEKGEEVWAFSVGKNGKRTQNIPVSIPGALSSDKPKTINAYLKLFFCTEEFNTDGLNQKGITQKSKAKRSRRIKLITHSDWMTKEIFLNIKSN